MDMMDRPELLDTDPSVFVRLLLASLGLPADPLQPASGWSNSVWLAPAHVVRLSSGRFRAAYAHERAVLALLSPAIPHAETVASGQVGCREWMILRRVEGQPLLEAWSSMTEPQRHDAIDSLGDALCAIHNTLLPTSFHNPWLDDALAPGGNIKDAYHAPPDRYRQLLDAAAKLPGVDRVFLHRVGAFIEQRLPAFAQDYAVLVHGDLHFANVLWDGARVSAVLDFESARPAARDLDLDTLLRFTRAPEQESAPGDRLVLTARDLAAVPRWVMRVYPALFSHPRLTERLEAYEALWQLVQLLHFPPGVGPLDPWGALTSLLTSDNCWARF